MWSKDFGTDEQSTYWLEWPGGLHESDQRFHTDKVVRAARAILLSLSAEKTDDEIDEGLALGITIDHQGRAIGLSYDLIGGFYLSLPNDIPDHQRILKITFNAVL